MNKLKTIAEEVLASINKRIFKIDYNQDKYSCEIYSNGNITFIVVKYDNVEFLRFNLIPHRNLDNKQNTHYGIFHVYAIDDVAWYNNRLTHKNINVDEKMMCGKKPLSEVLDGYLSLGEKGEKQRIEILLNEMNITYDKISYDTINCRYVILLKPQLYESVIPQIENKLVYKYTTLKTFLKIAKNKKYRLNSIVSMNDTSEAFFLGDYLCDAYKDNLREKFEINYGRMDKYGLRHSKLLEYKSQLIGSFTINEDDPIMWERYGDNYKGVCIGFKYNPLNMRPITYCGRNKDSFFYKLKTISERLSSEGIAIYFDFISKEQFFVKHWQFESENEIRLLKECDNKDGEFQYELYGDLISYYREYELKELDLEPVCLWIGANMPNKDVNFPIICQLAKCHLGINEINFSKCDKYRI